MDRNIFMTIWLAAIACNSAVLSLEEDLIDTRAATSDVGWVMPQGSEWQEATSPNKDGNEQRVLMVCQMHKVKQNNWVRSPFIPVQGASRIYVEFEFSMRSCEDVPNVATCKETFNLYYYETNRDEATSTFPPWSDNEYIKVDTIAADKRFHRGSTETNIETRDVGPITKNGIYFAIQDSGSCMAIMHLRVYYKYCPSITQNFAVFRKTVAGPERTSLVEVEGVCVDNAANEKNNKATLHCNSDGVWAVPKGQCACDPGFTPSPDHTSCKACGRGSYKPSSGNNRCERCPAYSHSRDYSSAMCDCMFGYFRATSDEATSPCTKPPSKPFNLQADVNGTGVTLSWDQPINDGGRDDVTYSVECEKCENNYLSCVPCSHGYYIPSKSDVIRTMVKVRGLKSSAHYKFKVFAKNGVSYIASEYGAEPEFASVTITTEYAKPPKVFGLHASNIESHSFTINWESPNLREELRYEVIVFDYYDMEPLRMNVTTESNHEIKGLTQEKVYIVEVRAINDMGYGPVSNPLKIKTLNSLSTPPPNARQNTEDDSTFLVVAAVAGVLLIVLIVSSFCIWRRRYRKREKGMRMDLEKFPVFKSTTLLSSENYPLTHKTYIDPTTYNDPQRAVLDFANEIDITCVKIESVIGGGEFGEVCRGYVLPVEDKPREVAIKTLKSGYSTQQKLDFLGEASIMGQFDHPNVIRLEGVVTKSRPLMIITEYMENGSLDTYLKNHDNEFTVVQLVGMLRNISDGMKYLSEMGYIHRDLAARNILVNGQLICKVSDFGMSRVLEDEEDATYTTRGGKIPIRWTAPESITFRKFTSSSDVWSYGIVMWEVMSYGERPYWGMSNQDVIQAVGSGYRLPAPMDCPIVLHHLMLECWKKNRVQRPKFAEIVTALDRIMRAPAQLKLIAGVNGNNNGRLVPSSDGLLPVPAEERRLLSIPSASDVSEKLFAQDPREVSVLEKWLNNIGLASYKDNFLQCGFYSLEQISGLKPHDLCKLGMADSNDQNTLLDNMYALKYGNTTIQHQRNDNLEGVAV